MKTLKVKALRLLIKWREFGSTEKGERVTVICGTVATALFVVDLTVLILGLILS